MASAHTRTVKCAVTIRRSRKLMKTFEETYVQQSEGFQRSFRISRIVKVNEVNSMRLTFFFKKETNTELITVFSKKLIKTKQ